MKRASILLCVVSLSFVTLASAQAPPAPKPAPELQRLNYFAGNWKSDSDMKANPWGPAGKVTGKDRSEWAPSKPATTANAGYLDGGGAVYVPRRECGRRSIAFARVGGHSHRGIPNPSQQGVSGGTGTGAASG